MYRFQYQTLKKTLRVILKHTHFKVMTEHGNPGVVFIYK